MEELKVNFRALRRVFIKEFWRILVITFVFVGLGVGYALWAREEFKTAGSILPELQGKSGGGLSQFAGLASLAGVDLSSIGGGGVDAVRPDLYPNVIMSTPFYLELFKFKVRTKDNKTLTFEEFYHNFIEEGHKPTEKQLKSYPVKENGIIVINRLNEIRLKDLRDRITASIDKKSGVISIVTKMPDPVVAADVTRFAMEYLMDYVKNYRTEKLRLDVDYLANQVAASRGKYYSTQEKKAQYTDQFKDIALQSADIRRERIESEYRLSSSFYNELLKKYEEAKFKLHQETPVFKVLEPPVVPVLRSEPKRKIIVFLSTLFGFLVATAYSLLRQANYKSVFVKQ